jgi:NAD(P)-dependent dehydrogenase (short-subunit alcohol dehydrogenase family)
MVRLGRIDILSNNAGVAGPLTDCICDLPLAEWRRIEPVDIANVALFVARMSPG